VARELQASRPLAHKSRIVPGGAFPGIHAKSGRPAATASAVHNPRATRYYVPFGGEVGYVTVDPGQRIWIVTSSLDQGLQQEPAILAQSLAPWFWGRMPSALIRDAKVVGFSPSNWAAPPGPDTLPFAAASAARMLSASSCRI
jgi:hypothetical protein